MSKSEEKSERFIRVGTRRTENVMRAVRSLSKCSNPNNYEYKQNQVEKIFRAIQKELKVCKAHFDSSSVGDITGFKL